jgi:hypothetical protein
MDYKILLIITTTLIITFLFILNLIVNYFSLINKLNSLQERIKAKLIQIYDYAPSVFILTGDTASIPNWLEIKQKLWGTSDFLQSWDSFSGVLAAHESLLLAQTKDLEVSKKSKELIQSIHELVHKYNDLVIKFEHKSNSKIVGFVVKYLRKTTFQRYLLLKY